jgi:serine/threonine protein kinase
MTTSRSCPKGTLDYLDPEFLQNIQIADKNDFYSFSVVLIELLTSKKPSPKEQKNLKIVFQESITNETLIELLDADIIDENKGGQTLVVSSMIKDFVVNLVVDSYTHTPNLDHVACITQSMSVRSIMFQR